MNILENPPVPTDADLARNRARLLATIENRATAARRRHRLTAGIVTAGVLLGGATAGVIALNTPPAAVAPTPAAHEPGRQPGPLGTVPPYDAYAGIPEDEIERLPGGVVDILWDARDPYYGYDKLPVVARVHIGSIDGGRTFSPISEQYVFPQTVGKMTVLEVYKGGITPGDRLNYARLGGIVSYDDYWKALNQQQRDKRLQRNGGNRPTGTKYVQKKLMDDIDIEAGKDYIVFLLPQSSKDGKLHEYFIDGFQFGLREVKGTGSGMRVLNNVTKEWESLGSIVRLP